MKREKKASEEIVNLLEIQFSYYIVKKIVKQLTEVFNLNYDNYLNKSFKHQDLEIIKFEEIWSNK